MDEQTLRLECLKLALEFAPVYGRDKDMTDLREFAEELFGWARTLGDDLPRYRGPNDSEETKAVARAIQVGGPDRFAFSDYQRRLQEAMCSQIGNPARWME